MSTARPILKQFFATHIMEVIDRRRHKLRVREEIQNADIDYVTSVLADYAAVDVFRDRYTRTPGIDVWAGICQSKPSRVQQVADYCLFRTGMFPHGYQRIPREYFIRAATMGYQSLSDRQFSNASMSRLYRSLAENFPVFTGIINEFALEGHSHAIEDLVALWQETGNPSAEAALLEAGIFCDRQTQIS